MPFFLMAQVNTYLDRHNNTINYAAVTAADVPKSSSILLPKLDLVCSSLVNPSSILFAQP